MENEIKMSGNDPDSLKRQLSSLSDQDVFINLSPKNENFSSPQEARNAVPESARAYGLLIAYFCRNRLLVDKFTSWDLRNYSNPYYWEAHFGTQDNGLITDFNYVPKSWELRKGSYFTTELKGTLPNFSNIYGTNYGKRDGLKRLRVQYEENGNLQYWSDVLEYYTGIQYQWGAVTRGAIEQPKGYYQEGGKYYADVIVYPNTLCAGVGNKFTLNESGTVSHSPDKKIKPGTYKLQVGDNGIFTLAVNSAGELVAFGCDGWVDTFILPFASESNDYLLLGFFGHPYAHINYAYYAPYSGDHVINNIALKYQHSVNLSRRTFTDITPYVEHDGELPLPKLEFKGEALLNDKITAEENTYYLTYFDQPGAYRYDHIPLAVRITKPGTAIAIRYTKNETDGILKWDYVEVPVSAFSYERDFKVDQYTFDDGVYVVHGLSHTYIESDLIGSENVKIVCVGGLGDFCMVNFKNIDLYNGSFHDYQGKLNYTIENCTFTGHPSRYNDTFYFLNTAFYQWHLQHNVVIRNCNFNLPRLFICIHGSKLDSIEITGCTFNVENIYTSIRINDCENGAVIRNNKVMNGITGIFFGSNRDKPVTNCLVENNVLLNQSEEAIAFDGFGNNYYLCPVIGNGRIIRAFNDANGKLVIQPKLIYITEDFVKTSENEYPEIRISALNNWTNFYATFNRGTGIDGTLCPIISYDAAENTLTLDTFMDASKVSTSEDSFFGVQSGFFDCVVRNNIIKSDRRPDYCVALSLFLNVFNMTVENNKVYLMNSFLNVAGGLSLSVYETLAWGNKIINNTFMNCNQGSFSGYSHRENIFIPHFNNVFRGNLVKNVKTFIAEMQHNFDYGDNIFDNVENSYIAKCKGYVPDETNLRAHHLGQVYNEYINDADGNLLDIEQKIVRRDPATGLLTLKSL